MEQLLLQLVLVFVRASQSDSCHLNSATARANKPGWLLRRETFTVRASNGRTLISFQKAVSVLILFAKQLYEGFSLDWNWLPVKSELPVSGRPGWNLQAEVTKHGLYPKEAHSNGPFCWCVAHIHSVMCAVWLRVSVPPLLNRRQGVCTQASDVKSDSSSLRKRSLSSEGIVLWSAQSRSERMFFFFISSIRGMMNWGRLEFLVLISMFTLISKAWTQIKGKKKRIF